MPFLLTTSSRSFIVPCAALLLMLVSTYSAWAQQRNPEDLRHDQRHKVTEKLRKMGSQYHALDHLKELVEEHPGNEHYLLSLGETYLEIRDYIQAEQAFRDLKGLGGEQKDVATYYLAISLKHQEKYEQASQTFHAFLETDYRDKRGEHKRREAAEHRKACENAILRKKEGLDCRIDHLGDNINAGYSDFSPRIYKDSLFIFASLQEDTVLYHGYEEKHFHQVKLYKSRRLNDLEFEEPQEIEELNYDYEHAANGTYSLDGKEFFFTRCYQDKHHKMICHIYRALVLPDGSFGKAKKMKGKVNRRHSSSTMPHIAPLYTRRDTVPILYFASNRKRREAKFSLGVLFNKRKRERYLAARKEDEDFDIYYTNWSNRYNKWRRVRKVGRKVNGRGSNEISPHYDPDLGRLYFSSDSPEGMGGYDVYFAEGERGRFRDKENVGYPVNTGADDTYFTLEHGKWSGYFVSNRPGGMSVYAETCCDDIYSVKFKKPALLAFQFHKDNLSDVHVTIKDRNTAGRVKPGHPVATRLDWSEEVEDTLIFSLRYDRDYTVLVANEQNQLIDSIAFTQADIPNLEAQFGGENSMRTENYYDEPLKQVIVEIAVTDSAKLVPLAARMEDEQLEDFKVHGEEAKKKPGQSGVADEQLEDFKVHGEEAKKKPGQSGVGDEQLEDFKVHGEEERKKPGQSGVGDEQLEDFKVHGEEERKKPGQSGVGDEQLEDFKVKDEGQDNTPKKPKPAPVPKDQLEDFAAQNENEDKVARPVSNLRINFEFDQTDFKTKQQKVLDSVVAYLKAYENIKVRLEGHTDHIGPQAYNQRLSVRRAKDLKAYLVKQGVKPIQISTVGKGEEEPLVSNTYPDGRDNPQNRYLNRRVEIIWLL